MRLISLSNCKPGMILAKPIYNDNGSVLVGYGVSLTERMIENLRKRNVIAIYIQHESTNDIIVYDNIPLSLRTEAIWPH